MQECDRDCKKINIINVKNAVHRLVSDYKDNKQDQQSKFTLHTQLYTEELQRRDGITGLTAAHMCVMNGHVHVLYKLLDLYPGFARE